MEATEQTEVTEPKKRRAAKKRRSAPRASVPVAAKKNDEFGGLTQTDCPFDCDPEKCAITHINVCGHPYKGGLQAALQSKPECVRRYNAARKVLAHQSVDKKG